jgi:hypothetical protein
VLSEHPRAEASASIGVTERELGGLLAAARKELRRTLATLAGSGWCERAERLISDRLDGALAAADARRLDVHLRNCARCVEHERRLVQATDALVIALGGRAGGGAPAPGGEPTPLVEAPPEQAAPAEAPPVEASPEELPPAEDAPEQAVPSEGAHAEEAVPTDDALTEVAPPVEEPPGLEEHASGAEQDAAGLEERIAAAAEGLVAVRTRRQIAGALAWNALVALAVLLAVATIALTLAGILGAQL